MNALEAAERRGAALPVKVNVENPGFAGKELRPL